MEKVVHLFKIFKTIFYFKFFGAQEGQIWIDQSLEKFERFRTVTVAPGPLVSDSSLPYWAPTVRACSSAHPHPSGSGHCRPTEPRAPPRPPPPRHTTPRPTPPHCSTTPPLKGASHRWPKFFSPLPFLLTGSMLRAPPPPLPPVHPGRRRHCHSVGKSMPPLPLQPPHGELPPLAIIVLRHQPLLTPRPTSCCRSTSRPLSTNGARRHQGNAATLDRTAALSPR
jgi:hypothetical protein